MFALSLIHFSSREKNDLVNIVSVSWISAICPGEVQGSSEPRGVNSLRHGRSRTFAELSINTCTSLGDGSPETREAILLDPFSSFVVCDTKRFRSFY